jgi:hypothetical protein
MVVAVASSSPANRRRVRANDGGAASSSAVRVSAPSVVVVVKRWSWYGRAGALAGVALAALAVGYDAPAALRGVVKYVRRNVAAQRADGVG